MLARSALACWFSIMHLIESTQGPCYLWTFTTAKPYPDDWFGNMHGNLIKYMGHESRQFSTGGKIPKDWGGVRVFEVHEKRKGGGLHAHWVMRHYMDWHTVNRLAAKAGFGRINVDPRPVTPAVAHYLASYLTKSSKLRGVRQWANIGTYDGVIGRNLVIISPRIERIKQLVAYYRNAGKHPYLAYRLALMDVDADGGDVPF